MWAELHWHHRNTQVKVGRVFLQHGENSNFPLSSSHYVATELSRPISFFISYDIEQNDSWATIKDFLSFAFLFLRSNELYTSYAVISDWSYTMSQLVVCVAIQLDLGLVFSVECITQ